MLFLRFLSLTGLMFLLSFSAQAEYAIEKQQLVYSNHQPVIIIKDESEKSDTLKANTTFFADLLTSKLTIIGADFKETFVPLKNVPSAESVSGFNLSSNLSEQAVLHLYTGDAGETNECQVLILNDAFSQAAQERIALLKNASLKYQIYPEHLSINCVENNK